MPLNDNELDHLFRDRLRQHSSPVRGDLWRRIHTGLGTPVRHLPLHRYWRYLGAGAATVTVAFAATLIFTPNHPTNLRHLTNLTNPNHPANPQLNHYSKISPSTNRPSDSRPSDPRHADPQHSDSIALNLTPTPDRSQPAVAKPESPTPVNPEASASAKLTATYDKRVNPDHPATHTSSRNHAATPVSNAGSTPKHTHYPFTLPPLARLSAPPAISARRIIPTHAQTLAGKSKSPITLHPRAPFHPFEYISVYGSPDFPNKDFDFSWTAGARITFQFARHWSFTTGVQYEQLNVPMADVGGGTTMPFHFSNLSIPLLAGYTTDFSRYKLTVTSGIFIHAYAKPVGSDTYNQGIGVPTDRNTNTFALGFDLERPVNNRWSLFIQPYLREEIFNGEIYIPAQSITNGILLGGRYHL